jgi:hypothetical protein
VEERVIAIANVDKEKIIHKGVVFVFVVVVVAH